MPDAPGAAGASERGRTLGAPVKNSSGSRTRIFGLSRGIDSTDGALDMEQLLKPAMPTDPASSPALEVPAIPCHELLDRSAAA